MAYSNDSGVMVEPYVSLLEEIDPEVQKLQSLLNHPTVRMEIEGIITRVIAKEHNLLERLDLLEGYLGVSAKTHFVDIDLDWEEMDDHERMMNPQNKRKTFIPLPERLSELEKKIIEGNVPRSENSLLSGNKTVVRAKLVMEELQNTKPNMAGKMLTSSEIYLFLSSESVSEECRILVKRSSSRAMIQTIMEKVVELYPDNVRKGKKRKGKGTSFLILKEEDDGY
ncbi:hypothetical protein [Methanosarcina sp. 1.H.A.2.2]|uniref:hypothetical protein n=1 Tax=Methanosarcina sp. 1.H.A.2.2 TaxID=1483601 RepID=UPI000621110E|nr:hypothetical protein [Methanosarcina sp. 1.H.A.2.2]KKH50174.1 hypothetical protein EO93_04450 [Methanosarcina sp. 1.H.A.2.2]